MTTAREVCPRIAISFSSSFNHKAQTKRKKKGGEMLRHQYLTDHPKNEVDGLHARSAVSKGHLPNMTSSSDLRGGGAAAAAAAGDSCADERRGRRLPHHRCRVFGRGRVSGGGGRTFGGHPLVLLRTAGCVRPQPELRGTDPYLRNFFPFAYGILWMMMMIVVCRRPPLNAGSDDVGYELGIVRRGVPCCCCCSPS